MSTLQDSLQGYTNEIESISVLLEDLANRNEDIETIVDREINRRLFRLNEDRKKFLEKSENQLLELQQNYEKECSTITEEARKKIFGAGTIQKLKKKVAKIEEDMKGFKIDVDGMPTFTTETIDTLSKRVKTFNQLYDEYNNTSWFDLNKTVKILTLNNALGELKNPCVSVAVQTIYLGLLCSCLVGAPFLALAGYLGLNGLELSNFLKQKQKEKVLIKKFLEVKASMQCIDESMEAELKLRCETLLDDKKTAYNAETTRVEEDMNLMLDKFDKQEEQTQALRDDDDFKQDNASKIPEEIERQRQERDKINEEIQDCEEQLDRIKSHRDDALRDKARLKEQIEEKYLTLTLGEERLLPNELFLGFHEDTDELITFAHNCDTVVVYYQPPKGKDTPDSIDDFVLMIIVQLFCTLESPAIDLRIFNDYSGNRPYAAFTGKDYDDIVTIIASDSQVSKGLKELQEEIISRTGVIGKRADNIQDFNRLMIETKSLPLPYVFVVCHSLNSKYYSDPTFIYLMREGPRVGIIPLVFVSLTRIQTALRGGNSGELKKYYSLLNSFKTKPFQFDTVSGKLIVCPDAVSSSYKAELIKALKGKERR